jgi:hypothetical protein
MNVRILLLLPLFAFLVSCGEEAKTPRKPAEGTIRGQVRDFDSGAPVGDARVELGDAKGLTTPEGTYDLSVTYGHYYVTVSKDGYEPYRSDEEVKIPPDGVASHDCKLRVQDSRPPEMEKFEVRERSTDFVMLAWATDEPSSGRVEIGLTSSYGRLLSSKEFKKNHELRIDGLKPGTKYFYKLSGRDRRGNAAQPVTGTFETRRPKDTKAPKSQLTKMPDPITRNRNVAFAWTASDDRSSAEKITYSFYLEGQERQFSVFVANTTRIYRHLRDGKYTFKIRAQDEDGNIEVKPVVFAFEVDTTAPQNPSLLPASATKFLVSRAINLVCSVVGASEMVLWEGNEPATLLWTPFREGRQFILSKGDGEKVVFVRFRDRAGNQTDAVTCTVILDTEPPSIPGGLKATVLQGTDVRIAWTSAKDKGSGVVSYVVLRDGLEIGKSRSTSFMDRHSKLGRRYGYSVLAVDRSGKKSDPSQEAVVTIKGRSPTVPCGPNPEDKSEDQPTGLTLNWRCTDPDRGDRLTFDLYFGTNQNPPLKASALTMPSFEIKGLRPAKTYYWRVEAQDLQGMTSKSPLWTFTTAENPNTAPAAQAVVTPLKGPARTEFRFDASPSSDKEDPLSSLQFCWDFDGDGKADTPWRNDSSYTKVFLKVGVYNVKVWVKDTRGAVSRSPVRFEVLNSPPVVQGNPMPLNGSTNEPVDLKLSWTFSDPDPGDKLRYDIYLGQDTGKLRAVAQKLETASFRPKDLRPGKLYYWRIDARDKAGAVTQGPLWSFATARREIKIPLRAEISVSPQKGRTTTPFRFDASGSRDSQDDVETLLVRWDWNGDGKTYSNWSAKKQVKKTFSRIGTLKIGIEVKNSAGKVAKSQTSIVIENTAPVFVGRPMPRNGATKILKDKQLAWDVGDPDPGDRVTYKVYLGRADKGGMKLLTTTYTKKSYPLKGKVESGRVYNWRIIAEDSHGAKTPSPIWTFSVRERENNAPYRPLALEAPGKIHRGDRVTAKTRAKDPDGDKVQMRFDWGDGTTSPYIDVNTQGWVTLSHLYAREGNYGVRAQAKDAGHATSPWSLIHFVTVLPPVKAGEEEEDLFHWDPKTRKSMPNLLDLQVKYWFANFGGWGAWKGVGDPLAKLDYRSDLGLRERKGAPWGIIEFGRNLSIGLEYFMLEYAGRNTLGQDSRFGGYFFGAGTDVVTTSRVRFGRFFAGFAPYLGTYLGGGVRLGAGYFWTKTTVTPAAGGETQVETLEFPVPLVGITLYGRVTKYFTVIFEGSYMEGSLQEFNLAYGRLLDISGEVLFTPIPFVGLSLGYRYTAIKMRISEGTMDTAIDLSLDGFFLAIAAHF